MNSVISKIINFLSEATANECSHKKLDGLCRMRRWRETGKFHDVIALVH
jgi:hypothetical protein